jgi:hypothetical protein
MVKHRLYIYFVKEKVICLVSRSRLVEENAVEVFHHYLNIYMSIQALKFYINMEIGMLHNLYCYKYIILFCKTSVYLFAACFKYELCLVYEILNCGKMS